jgi:hypothetical protein
MNILPHSTLGRFLLGLWFAACVAVLVFAFVQRDIHDTDIAVAWFMIFLTFPIGYGLAAFLGFVFMLLYDASGVVVPGGFVFNSLSWLLFVAAGFFQWFLVFPWVYRKVRKSSNSRLEADAP